MTPTTQPDISLMNVTRTFGKVRAVNNLCLDIAQGELCCLVGPSGCGKSTTLRLIAGLERPDAGTISIRDKDVTATPARSRGVGLVFQNYALFPHMDIFGNVAYGLRSQGKPANLDSRVHEALSKVRLDGYAKRRPHELSGGEQQRAALARCLVTNPKVLLLDEPFSNLDAGLRLAMRQELTGLQQELGITTVFVTHDQEEAMTLAHRIVLMDHGEIVQTGPPRTLYEHPETLFAARFMGRINLLEPQKRNGRARVLGVVLGNADQECAAGVRPEHVSLSIDGPGEAAMVQEAVFTGPMVRYRFRLKETGQELSVERPAAEPVFERGEEAFLSTSKQFIHIFSK